MKFNYSFNNGPYVQIRESQGKSFLMEFGEFYLGNISKPRLLIDHIVNGDATYGIFREWYTKWLINLYDYDQDYGIRLVDQHVYNDSGKNVAILLESDDLYENRIWLDKCIEYQRKSNSKVFVFSKFYDFFEKINQNNLKICPPDAYFPDPVYKKAYNIENHKPYDIPDVSSKEFTWNDENGYYATYKIGRYDIIENGINRYGNHLPQDKGLIREHWWKQYESYKNPVDWKDLSSEELADHILGLNPLDLEDKLRSLKKHKYLNI